MVKVALTLTGLATIINRILSALSNLECTVVISTKLQLKDYR